MSIEKSGLVAIKTLLSRDPCAHAKVAIEMLDVLINQPPQQQYNATSDPRLMEMPGQLAGFYVVLDESMPPNTMKFVQPAQQQEPEPDRVKFERHWRKTRGEKKANRELPRHPLQPQTYIQDSANRHWVTWQAAVRSVFPPASKPLTDEQRNWVVATCPTPRHIIDTVEKMHGIKGDA